MWSKNRKGVLFLLALLTALTVIAVPAVPAALSADDSPVLQAAPLNPAFTEYLQRQRNALKAQQAATQGGTEVTPEPDYGYRPPTVDLSHIESTRDLNNSSMQAARADVTLAAAFNWKTPTDRVTSVKDQNPCGTCWTFSNINVMESKVWIDGLAADQDYSEQALNCCMDTCWTTLAANRCNAGGNDFMAQDTLIKKAARQEACQPYNTGTINAQACLTCTPTYMTTNFVWVAWNDSTVAARDAIKTAIQTYGPVTVAYYHDNSNLYAGAKYYYTGGNYSNHAVSIVGWDDTVAHPLGGGLGAWKTKNSWGTTFGDGTGYFWLCYGKSMANSFGSLRGVKAYNSAEKLYYWDEAGWISDVGYNLTTAWMANIFTASEAGNLTHVDFYATDAGEQYDIRVYKSGNINSLGTAVATKTGTCDVPGYYSIPLTTAVALTSGQAFTVVVKMTTTGYGLPLAYETVGPRYNPPIQAGVSYVSYDGSDWADLATSSLIGNFCLRARVSEPVSPPPAPTLTSPTNGSSQPGTSLTLTWNASSGATDYDLYIWSSSGTFHDHWVGNATSHTVTGLPNDGRTFGWRIYPLNSGGMGPSSPIWTFVNGSTVTPPPAPTLTSPTNGSSQPGTSLTLTWNASSGATDYDLYIWSSSGTFHDHWVGNATSHTVTGLPNDGRTFGWRIYPLNSGGMGPSSPIWTFVNGP
jgi:C1A family cysteine protease